MGARGYRHHQAQRKSNKRRTEAAKAIKMTADILQLIKSKLHEKWSPEQISGWLLDEKEESLSHESIYLPDYP